MIGMPSSMVRRGASRYMDRRYAGFTSGSDTEDFVVRTGISWDDIGVIAQVRREDHVSYGDHVSAAFGYLEEDHDEMTRDNILTEGEEFGTVKGISRDCG